MNEQDGQALKSREISAAKLADVFGIPPHLLEDLEGATFSSMEKLRYDRARMVVSGGVSELHEGCGGGRMSEDTDALDARLINQLREMDNETISRVFDALDKLEGEELNDAYARGHRDALDWAAGKVQEWIDVGGYGIIHSTQLIKDIRSGPAEGECDK